MTLMDHETAEMVSESIARTVVMLGETEKQENTAEDRDSQHEESSEEHSEVSHEPEETSHEEDAEEESAEEEYDEEFDDEQEEEEEEEDEPETEEKKNEEVKIAAVLVVQPSPVNEFFCHCTNCIHGYAAYTKVKTKSLCEKLRQAFTKHPYEQNITYRQHMLNSFRVAFHMGKRSLASFLHGIFPFLFKHEKTE